MDISVVIISSLAVWRAAYMLQNEDGPFGIFAKLQAWIANRPDKVGGINQGFFCFYCLSIWVAWAPAIFICYSIESFLVYWLAISTGAIFLNVLHEKYNQ